MRIKPDPQVYSFSGFGGEKFPNFMLRGAGDLVVQSLGHRRGAG